MATCYRHTSRETGVACSNCGRPICPECMTATSVGMRCPECAGQRTKVHTMRSIGVGRIEATQVLIAINIVAFIASGSAVFTLSGSPDNSSWVLNHGFLSGPTIHDLHQYYRLVTSGFLHEDFLHIGFNMYLLYVLGRMLEPAIGRVRFVVIYFTALLAGSFGALLFTPTAGTIGASGAIFGLMGAAVFEMRARGVDPMASGIVPLIVVNLILSLTLSNISIGGHLGGLVGGALASLVLQRADRLRSAALGYGGCAAIAIVSVLGAVLVAQG